MAKQSINVGTSPNDNRGDSLRISFQKINANFTELYNATGGGLDLLNVASSIIPSATNIYDLGSPTRQWRSLYVSTSTIYLGGTALSIDGSGNLTVGGSRVGATSYTDLTGKPALSTVATTGSYTDLTNRPALFSGSYADLTNKPNLGGTYQFSVAADDSTQRVISTDEVVKFVGAGGITTASDSEGKITITQGTTSSLVNGAQTVSLSSSPVSGTTFSSGLTIHRLSGSMANITSDINKVLQIATQTSNGRNEWSFGTNSSLTFPDATVQTTAWTGIANALRSEGNINIDINLADSTLRRWSFGEDGILTLPSVGKISNGAYDWTFGSTGITTFPGVINAGNIKNLVVNDLGGGTSLTAGSQVQIGNSAGIAGAGVLIKNAVTNNLDGEFSSTLEAGSKIQMDNGNVSLYGYTYNTLGGESPSGLENRLVVEVDNSYLNNVVRIGTRAITTTGGNTTVNSFQGVTFSRQGDISTPGAITAATATIGGVDLKRYVDSKVWLALAVGL